MERFLTPLSSVGEGQDPGTPLTGFAETCAWSGSRTQFEFGAVCAHWLLVGKQ